MAEAEAPVSPCAFLAGGGETGATIRAHDWTGTSLGAPETWPAALKTAVSLLLTSAGPVYVGWGPDLVSLYNDAYLPIVGTKHPGVGLPFAELWAEIWDAFRPIVEATMMGKAQHFVDLPIALSGRPGLPVGYFTFSYTPLRGDDGGVEGFYCATTETTEKVLAERQHARGRALLAAQNEVLELAVQDVPLGRTLDAIVRTVERLSTSGVLASILLVDEDGMHLRSGAAPSLPAAYNEAIDGIAIGPGVGSCGSAAHAKAPVFVADIVNETLERRVAETSADLDRVWRIASDIFVVVDGEGLFRRVNPAATAILGWDQDDMIGRSVFDFVHPDDIDATRGALQFARAGNVLPTFENRYRTKDGGLRTIAWVAASEGALSYGYGRDITAEKDGQAELEAAQEALRQSQKMEAIGQLTGGVAHDFNNLLTPIVGSLDMLQRKGLGSEREQRLIAGAAQSAERARTLVQRLLAFARRQPLQTVAVDIVRLIDGMGDLVASTTGPQIKVVVEAADNLPPAKADPNQLEMALLNLSVNARDAMPEGGTLRITATAESVAPGHSSQLSAGDYIRLSVADTGAGMEETTLARAIEPFFSTKGVGRGTGLGLSMVHGLASQLGGALTIQSRPGLGTNVELWLPQSGSAPATWESPPAVVPAPGTRRAALLVDDEELVRMSTAEMLGDLGYDVIEATSAEEALRLASGGARFDLLITDHLMPGMNGTDLAHAIQTTHPGVPVLLVSGYADRDGLDADLSRLTKPFRRDELAACLAQL